MLSTRAERQQVSLKPLSIHKNSIVRKSRLIRIREGSFFIFKNYKTDKWKTKKSAGHQFSDKLDKFLLANQHGHSIIRNWTEEETHEENPNTAAINNPLYTFLGKVTYDSYG